MNTGAQEHEPPRLRAFDGLRGFGMCLVLLRHVAQDLPDAPLRDPVMRVTSLGMSMMDMFFVLSGFLITGLLYDAKSGPHYFRNYFARRCLRVFPLYYGALIVIMWIIPAMCGQLSEAYGTLVDNQVWYWGYATNVLIAVTRGLGTPLNTSHLWSLAVEEQFYLTWPLLLWFLQRRGILRLCVICMFGAVVFRFVLHSYFDARGVYVLTPARMDALAFGGIMAVLSRDPGGIPAVARRCVLPLVVTLAGMAAIVWHAGALNRLDPYNYLFGYSMMAVFYGCVLMLLAAHPRSWVARLLSTRFLTHLGRHSYAMYIVHYPLVLLLVSTFDPRRVIDATGGTFLPAFFIYSFVAWSVSLLLAWVIWHAFEKWFLDLKRYFPAPPAIRVPAD